MYERGRTLFDHQQVACTVLGFQWMSEHQRRSLVRELRDEVARCADRDQLLVRARQWLYKNKLVIVHVRSRSREVKATGVTLKGTQLSFTVPRSSSLTMVYKGTIAGDSISGTMEYRPQDGSPSRRKFSGRREKR